MKRIPVGVFKLNQIYFYVRLSKLTIKHRQPTKQRELVIWPKQTVTGRRAHVPPPWKYSKFQHSISSKYCYRLLSFSLPRCALPPTSSLTCFFLTLCAHLYRQLFHRDTDKNSEGQAIDRLYSYGNIDGVLKMIQSEATVSCPCSQHPVVRDDTSAR